MGHLLANRPDLSDKKVQRTVAEMNKIPPAAPVERYEQYIGTIDMRDKDDRHVVAAGIACGAQKILTWNLGDFPNQVLAAFGLVAESPDKFLSQLIIDSPMSVVDVFKTVRERFKAPPMSVDYFFTSLEKNRLVLTAKQLTRYRDLM